ncbi:MAG: hypothetical protein HYY59_01425 [Candidatus Omnitrophica bacterium]|nr:hypothetical protein [Candidatus Omnitrophota bacterium]MBI3020649.1 hypothetical protein [Candidatus Omnitrophota bacterium]
MIRCPICQRALRPFTNHPYAPICSEACRKEALRRSGYPTAEEEPQAQFEQLQATHLYCPTCRRSMPTKERLLLTLPSGHLFGYSCAQCGTDVGTKTDTTRASS